MNQNKKFQTILDEVMEISRIPMVLYDMEGTLLAQTSTPPESAQENVLAFIHSDISSQTLGNFYYFKVICEEVPSFILLAADFASDTAIIGRLTVCQLQHLLEAREDTITRAGFVRSLVSGSLSPVEITRQAKKLKLPAAERTVYVIEYEEGFADSYAYQTLQAFSERRGDLCCELDEYHLLLAKDNTNTDPALFAQTLADTLRAEALIQTHIGYSMPASTLPELGQAYQQAVTALKIRQRFFAEQDTACYGSLGLGRLIAELPVELCQIFLHEVFGNRIPDQLTEEEQTTLHKFFENNLNISETARQLYLHRNTLVYRLERLEKKLGLDIRRFEDAMTFKVAMMILAHVRAEKKG